MKVIKHLIFGLLLFLTASIYAQNPDREISQETTEKNYTIYEEGRPVKKSVKIHTVIRQAVKFDTLVENRIDAERINTPKEITKTISIDNDSDPDYDETIKFSYTSDAGKDFLVKSNDDEIFKSIENSKYLSVKDHEENKDMSDESLNSMFTITDDKGKTLKLILEEQESMK